MTPGCGNSAGNDPGAAVPADAPAAGSAGASGTLAVTVVPTPGREVTVSRPPISSARSAIDASP